MPVLEIALSLTLLAMTENPLKTVIASDRRERGNHVFRIVTQFQKKGDRGRFSPRQYRQSGLNCNSGYPPFLNHAIVRIKPCFRGILGNQSRIDLALDIFGFLRLGSSDGRGW